MMEWTRWRWNAGLATSVLAMPLCAQITHQDSAGIAITTSAAPSRAQAAITLADTPRLIIGSEGDSSTRFQSIRHVSVLSDGRIVVADRGTGQLRYFSPAGAFVFARAGVGSGPGQIPAMRLVRRTGGDTLAIVTGITTAVRFDGAGVKLDTAQSAQPSGPPRQLLAEVLASGHHLEATLGPMEERARGQIWVASMPFQLRDPASGSTIDLGSQPMGEMEQTASGPVPRWLSPVGAIASSPSRLYLGFGSRFEVRAYSLDGTLHSIIRRAWTPVPITDADWETWVVEWSKIWIKSTGDERVREVQAMRDAPWAATLPAFSQLLADRVGRVWVRRAHWQDAIGAGSLTDMPVVPSEWSVFDDRGEWLYDATMPAYFEPFEIGADYVAGRLLKDTQQLAAIFALVPTR